MIRLQRRATDTELVLPDSLHPLLRRVYQQRKLATAEELDLTLSKLIPPDSMLGMQAAVDLLLQALQQQSRVLIVSDFDADGATSCALAIAALKQFGYQHVDYIVPNRFEYGYGLTPEIVELAATKSPNLIITVDNGISSVAGVRAAQAIGSKVLITDHHIAPNELPSAEAIVNPNQAGCSFSSKAIAGVGVVFYVMLALRSRLREMAWFRDNNQVEPNMAELLDLVALGTIADVVPLDHNNRILVAEGLRRIRGGRARSGINALLQVAKKNAVNLSASDLAFGVGPRLNAAGRLDDMTTGIECLLTDSDSVAHRLALQLDGMNQDRRQIESEMRDQAFESLANLELDAADIPAGLCLFDERWHQGVVGILASRIKEKYHRPIIAFAAVEGGEELKGSARSIPGFHIRDALDAVATRNPGLVTKFGGHAMAAGLSLARADFERFSEAFAAEAARQLSAAQLQAMVESDGEVSADFMTLEAAQVLRSAGPWGQEFPEPLFDGNFILRDKRVLADKHLKMVLSPESEPEKLIDAIVFNVGEDAWPAADASRIGLVFRLDVNEYRNSLNLQLLVERILGSE